MLEAHRQQNKAVSPEDYIFAGQRGAPMNLNNLLRRVILPVLEDQRKKHDLHADKLQFKGWHAFRRGLSSNLYSLGVRPRVIQAIMRHADIGTTLGYYVQTPDAESRKTLQMIEETLRRKPQLGHIIGHIDS